MVAADCVRISRLGGEIRTTAGYSQRWEGKREFINLRDGAVEYLVALPVWQILSGEAHQRATWSAAESRPRINDWYSGQDEEQKRHTEGGKWGWGYDIFAVQCRMQMLDCVRKNGDEWERDGRLKRSYTTRTFKAVAQCSFETTKLLRRPMRLYST